jgi:hypothetical protein
MKVSKPPRAAEKPNPGSDAALSAGCLCPVFDNNYGRRPPISPASWWITVGCPVHDPQGARVRKIA